jgi:hypothetical protein
MKILALIFALLFPLPGFVSTAAVLFSRGIEATIVLSACEDNKPEETIPMDCPVSEENTETTDSQENSEQSDNAKDLFAHSSRHILFLSSLVISFISSSNSLLAYYFKIPLPPPEL